jgi:hypothetical protein
VNKYKKYSRNSLIRAIRVEIIPALNASVKDRLFPRFEVKFNHQLAADDTGRDEFTAKRSKSNH